MNLLRRSFGLWLLAMLAWTSAAVPVHAFVQDSDARMRVLEKFDFAKQLVTPEKLDGIEAWNLALIRGIVFGRHGRVFREADIQTYLAAQPWYKPNPNFSNSMLNDVERKNLDTIRGAEAHGHDTIAPGDLRWWRDREIAEDKLGDHTSAELRVMIAEVEAIHGKRFDDEPWLQSYFEERYWYQPSASYDPKSLTALERKNIDTMQEAQRKQRQAAIWPGDMEYFQSRAITEDMLQGLELYELRLLRNEIFAREGRAFRTPWLAQYFSSQPWYSAKEGAYD